MANNPTAIRSDGKFRARVLLATAIEIGDLVYRDPSTYDLLPAADQTDQLSEEANQRLFAKHFAGVSENRSVAASDSADVLVDARLHADFRFTAPSATYRFGELLAISEAASGTALSNSTVEKTTDPDLAIFVVSQESADASAATEVICRILPGRGLAAQLATASEPNVETLAGTKTLTEDDKHVQILDPGGSDRNVILPPEALGLVYTVINSADADETLTILNDGSTITVANVDRGGVASLECDGTSWFAVSGNQHGPAVNVATMAATLTMDGTSALVQILDPDSAVRIVLMPTEAVAKGRGVYKIVNNATAGVGFAETITIKEDSNTTFLKYLRPGESCELVCDGTAWHVVSESFGSSGQVEAQSTVAGALALTDAMLPVQRITTDAGAVLVLPAEAGTNREFLIAHVAGAHIMRVDNDAAGVIITDIGNGENGRVWSDGTNWYGETFQIT